MKALYEINDSHDLEKQRVILLRKMHKQERVLDSDMQRINKKWHRWKQLGSSISNLALAFMPKLNIFSVGLSALKFFRRKK